MLLKGILLVALCPACAAQAGAQRAGKTSAGEDEFGPIVRAYLGYLRAQQEVVDDRVSRREVDRRYYVRNSNRIRALRQMAMHIARETENDYLPELEAVSPDEFEQLFFDPAPKTDELAAGAVINYQFRFLGAVTAGREKFYVFARLDPFEQVELRKKDAPKSQTDAHAKSETPPPDSTTRPRRVISP